jgi:choline dehydrogenase
MDRTVTPKGRRASTARGYLDQARSRSNLKIVTHALTDRIRFEGKRAVGVDYLQGESNQITSARRVGSVAVCRCDCLAADLQRSGVGPAALLNRLDIDLVHDLPGVGENLQDHLELYLQYACTQPVSLYPSLLWYNQPKPSVQSGCSTGQGHRRQQPVRSRWLYPHPRRVRMAEHPVPLLAGSD